MYESILKPNVNYPILTYSEKHTNHKEEIQILLQQNDAMKSLVIKLNNAKTNLQLEWVVKAYNVNNKLDAKTTYFISENYKGIVKTFNHSNFNNENFKGIIKPLILNDGTLKASY